MKPQKICICGKAQVITNWHSSNELSIEFADICSACPARKLLLSKIHCEDSPFLRYDYEE